MPLITPLSIAPMIDWTDRHFRIFMRLLAPQALLYTEMHTAPAITHNPSKTLYFNELEKPLAIQLGGADSQTLLIAAQQAQDQGYDEINLNLGCPSDRVQAGRFGACLMAEPEQVASIITLLKKNLNIPITAKTRIGIDHQDSYPFFATFIHRLVDAGCDKIIVHARKAWLKGLSPRQNRTIPPIQYDYVYRIKQALPHTPIIINGNITSIADIQMHLTKVDGVMIGRLACDNPYAIALIHHALYPNSTLLSRHSIATAYCAYLESIRDQNIPLSILLKPLLNLSHGLANGRIWKDNLMQIQRANTYSNFTNTLDFFKN